MKMVVLLPFCFQASLAFRSVLWHSHAASVTVFSEKTNMQRKARPLPELPVLPAGPAAAIKRTLTAEQNAERELDCQHFDVCPGCGYDRELTHTPRMNQARAFLGLNVTLDISSGWRTHAKLAAGPRSKFGGVQLGLYESRSHSIRSIPACAVHAPTINTAAGAVEAACHEAGVSGFSEREGGGMLRYVQLSVEEASGLVQVTLVWNAESYRDASPHAQRLLKRLRANNPDLFHSIWFHWRTGDGNAIFARGEKKWHRAYGPEFLLESLLVEAELANDLTRTKKLPVFHFSPMVFRQANLGGFSKIIDSVVSMVKPGDVVCELYAGIGLIGLSVLARSKVGQVRCSDQNPYNLRCFEQSLKSLDSGLAAQAGYVVASAEEALLDLGEADGANVIIVDPPRKGLEPAVLECLCRGEEVTSVDTLIYVSCGFEALQRELPVLANAWWIIESSSGYALFPGSDHIETLVILRRPI